MTVQHDEMWADVVQFDREAADGVWDGTHRDPDAPAWYRDLRSLIHRARGPAEPHELVDEPVVVATMRGVTRGERVARLPRSRGVRTLGQVVAMKAAAATTVTMVSVAAAAAATTGIVATVAATVVVPAVAEHVVPMIGEHFAPRVAVRTGEPGESPSGAEPVRPADDPAATAPGGEVPAVEAVPPTEPASAPAAVEDGGAVTPAAGQPVAPAPEGTLVEAPVEGTAGDPLAAPTTDDVAPVDPARPDRAAEPPQAAQPAQPVTPGRPAAAGNPNPHGP
jgi:hypothetical protein